jgi:hypothetical protein
MFVSEDLYSRSFGSAPSKLSCEVSTLACAVGLHMSLTAKSQYNVKSSLPPQSVRGPSLLFTYSSPVYSDCQDAQFTLYHIVAPFSASFESDNRPCASLIITPIKFDNNTPTLMPTHRGTSTTTMSFTSLPAELRITIYQSILQTARPRFSSNLRKYQGLVFANKQIHKEFVSEAIKAIHSAITRHWSSDIPIYIAPAIRLSQCTKPCISIPQSSILPRNPQTTANLEGLLMFLFRNVTGFTLSIDSDTRGSPWFDNEQYGLHVLENYHAYRQQKPVKYREFHFQIMVTSAGRHTEHFHRTAWLERMCRVIARCASLDQDRQAAVYRIVR